MAGFVPAIHVFLTLIPKDVDARDRPGHDEEGVTYALLFAPTPLNDAGTVSGSLPSLCTAAKMAAMYP